MFQRYTERARRVIFFARYEASQTGSTAIETEHMLLGLMRENADFFQPLTAGRDVDAFRAELFGQLPSPPPASKDLPLTETAKRVLKHAESEASALAHRHIGTEHLLLGVLRESDSRAAQVLEKYGITREQVLEKIPKGSLADPDGLLWAALERSDLHALLDKLPEVSLSSAQVMLERILAGPSYLASRFPSKTETVGWNFPPIGTSSGGGTRTDDDAWVNEAHHKFAGQSIRVIQRFRLSADHKTLIVSYEIRGPKGEHRGEAELDVS